VEWFGVSAQTAREGRGKWRDDKFVNRKLFFLHSGHPA
jgi:hypothetical protein